MNRLPPFQTLLDEHAAIVMATLRGAVGRNDAEDCFQETFLAALRAYPKLRDAGNLRGWLLTIAHRKAIDHHRANGRRPLPVAEPIEVAVHDPEPGRRDLGRGRDTAAETAGGGRPALRRRPPPRRDRRRARLLTGGGAAQPARGNQAIEKGAGMKAEIRRLTERAADEGLIDVAYTTTDSPFGELLLAGTSRGLVRVGLPGQEPDELLEDLAARISPRVLEAPDRLEEARRELDRYFEGGLTEFDLPLDWRLSHDFRRRVLRAIDRIPYGKTRSYTEVAASAGNERAVRAAGSACGSNPIPIVVPCHRVLRTGGALGGYGGGLPMKRGPARARGRA